MQFYFSTYSSSIVFIDRSFEFQAFLGFMVGIFRWNGGRGRHLGYGPCSTATSWNAPVPIHNLREGRNHTFSEKRKQQQNSKRCCCYVSCNVSSNLSHNCKLLWHNEASCIKTKQFLGLRELNNREWRSSRNHHFKIKLGATLKSMPQLSYLIRVVQYEQSIQGLDF